MGDSLDKIVDFFLNIILKKVIFFIVDKNYFNFFKNRCEDKNIRVFFSKNIKNEYWEIDFFNNIVLVMDICKYLNVDEKIVFEGMRIYYKDLGSLKVLIYLNKKNFRIFFVNILVVNDFDLIEIILDRVCIKIYWNNERYLFVNNRVDRLSRLK